VYSLLLTIGRVVEQVDIDVAQRIRDFSSITHADFIGLLEIAEAAVQKGLFSSAWKIYCGLMNHSKFTVKKKHFPLAVEAGMQSVGLDDPHLEKVIHSWQLKAPKSEAASAAAATIALDSKYQVNRLSYVSRKLTGIDRDAGLMGPRKDRAA